MRQEALPLTRNSRSLGERGVGLADAGERQRWQVFVARRGQICDGCFGHGKHLLDEMIGNGAPFACGGGVLAEPLAKCAGEGFVRSVAGLERELENVRRARGQGPRRPTETTRPGRAERRHPRRGGEDMGQGETRRADRLGDLIERQRLAQMRFDEPDGALDHVHVSFPRRAICR